MKIGISLLILASQSVLSTAAPADEALVLKKLENRGDYCRGEIPSHKYACGKENRCWRRCGEFIWCHTSGADTCTKDSECSDMKAPCIDQCSC